MSKLNQAIEIVNVNSDKNTAIEAIMERLSVTKSNAFVYWSKAFNKIHNITKDDVVRRKTNPITETTPQQHDKMVKDIDAVIEQLKERGIKPSPFPQI